MNVRKMLLPVMMFGAFMGSNAFAGCLDLGYASANPLILVDNEVDATSPGGENWNEYHCDSNELYKVGDGTAVDPTTLRGSWFPIPRGNFVRYNYGGPSVTYTWKFFTKGSSPTELCWENATTGEVIATGILKVLAPATCPPATSP